jgi:hypothetical protein
MVVKGGCHPGEAALSLNHAVEAGPGTPPRRDERSAAEPEIRNLKLETRNKSELTGMEQ